jgi:hypothetical protein
MNDLIPSDSLVGMALSDALEEAHRVSWTDDGMDYEDLRYYTGQVYQDKRSIEDLADLLAVLVEEQSRCAQLAPVQT